uniref:Reverse transcriptase zinc-binding domain-containing protein n=1 Tax=Ananas comosus var. bracteatus TaxID=296719 RepID=A0A6V7P417_ANACO|nr:unnamed protein product [Ananas comosus var. bracteatus]
MCGNDLETVDHLLVRCVISRFFMYNILEGRHIPGPRMEVKSVWELLAGDRRQGAAARDLIRAVICWWMIWRKRNNIIFRSQSFDPFLTIRRIRDVSRKWTEFCSS